MKVHPGGKVLRDNVAEEVRAEPRKETVHVVTQGNPGHTGSKDPPVHPVRKESLVLRGIRVPGVFRAQSTGRKNGFTNVCERCKYVVNLELQICITFALSAKVWANTYIC